MKNGKENGHAIKEFGGIIISYQNNGHQSYFSLLGIPDISLAKSKHSIRVSRGSNIQPVIAQVKTPARSRIMVSELFFTFVDSNHKPGKIETFNPGLLTLVGI